MGWRINTLLTNLILPITEYWSWIGIQPEEVIAKNQFGNLIVRDKLKQFWRICPEDCYCTIVAKTTEDYNKLITDQLFLHDWYMVNLVEQAEEKLGKLEDGFSYCFDITPALGGEYEVNNIRLSKTLDTISESGAIALQLSKQLK